MQAKRFKPEHIAKLLRRVERDIANGKTAQQACRNARITLETLYHWRKAFRALKLDQAKRQKALEKENTKLKQVVVKLLWRDDSRKRE